VSGVLTVIGGWFFTAMMAFTVSSIFATAVFFGGGVAVGLILFLAGLVIYRTHRIHRKRERVEESVAVFNLRKIEDADAATAVTASHLGILLREVKSVLELALDGLFGENRHVLRSARDRQRKVQQWANIIAANIFKVLRLLGREKASTDTARFASTISSLQEIAESVRDVAMRSYVHVANNHSGLLESQKAELGRIHDLVGDILGRTADAIPRRGAIEHESIARLLRDLRVMVHEFDQNQVRRIQDNSSKTRLSILSYSLAWDCLKIAEHTANLQTIFEDPLRPDYEGTDLEERETEIPA
jgi:Na+/phosphate symporter